MIRTIRMLMAATVVATGLGVPLAMAAEDVDQCVEQCYDAEERCLAQCEDADDPSACEETCRNTADACLDGCNE